MNRDFAEMLSALSAAGAEYLIVGAHGLPRATGDRADLWRNKRAAGRPQDLADLAALENAQEG